MNELISTSELNDYKKLMRLLAKESGEVIKQYFQQQFSVEEKSDSSPVTIADKEAEEVIRGLLKTHYPEHGILGEEFGVENPDSDWQWVIDPIDGTKSFICGAFDFGTIVGLTYQGKPVLGMVHQPILNELFIGDNETTTFNDEVITCREISKVEDAVLVTSDLLTVHEFQDPKGFNALTEQVKFSRTWGNCYGYTLLARGLVDIMVDPIAAPWDKIGVIPIINGAGGKITDYFGGDPVAGNSVVASNKQLHDKVISTLS